MKDSNPLHCCYMEIISLLEMTRFHPPGAFSYLLHALLLPTTIHLSHTRTSFPD